VLVVEDDPGLLRLVKLTLVGHGYAVLGAADGDEAMAIATDHDGEIDLLLTDVVLPGPGGRDVARGIRELRPDIEVLFMSGYAENFVIHHGHVDADVALLVKPFTPAQLLRRAHEILAPGRPRPRSG
jgi:CheY-like chemotaxis protein